MKGIDVPIERLRSKFDNSLWTDADTTFYGRIFRIDRDGIKPMNFVYPKDYEDVLTDDRLDALCFFDVLPTADYDGGFSSTVWIQFAVNLSALYGGVTERATEYAHEDALKVIKRVGGFSVTGLVRGIEAFADYTGVKVSDDMQPYYIFRIRQNSKIQTLINEYKY